MRPRAWRATQEEGCEGKSRQQSAKHPCEISKVTKHLYKLSVIVWRLDEQMKVEAFLARGGIRIQVSTHENTSNFGKQEVLNFMHARFTISR